MLDTRLFARRASLCVASTVTALVASVPIATATQEADTRELPDLEILADDDRLHPSVNAMPIEAEDFDLAVAAYREMVAIFDAAEIEVDQAEAALVDLRAERADLEGWLTEEVSEADRVRGLVVQERQDLREVAIQAYLDHGGAAPDDDAGALDADIYLSREHRRVLFETAEDSTRLDLEDLEVDLAIRQADIVVARQELSDLIETIGRVERTREEAIRRGLAAALQFEGLEAEILAARLDGTIAGTDIPIIAMDAYVRATDVLEEENEDCGLDWPLLAGVGKTESNHGLFGGAELEEGGDTSKKIFGVPLDGEETALILDSDGGALDELLEFDRAVGPMQFIPQTWRSFGRDATDDGRNDPHNMYDAALAAAHYLCSSVDEVASDEGQIAALLIYNQSTEYGDLVRERAATYAEVEVPAVKIPLQFAFTD